MSLCWPPSVEPPLLVRRSPRWGMSGTIRKSTATAANLSRIARTVRQEDFRIPLSPYNSPLTRREWEEQQVEARGLIHVQRTHIPG